MKPIKHTRLTYEQHQALLWVRNYAIGVVVGTAVGLCYIKALGYLLEKQFPEE